MGLIGEAGPRIRQGPLFMPKAIEAQPVVGYPVHDLDGANGELYPGPSWAWRRTLVNASRTMRSAVTSELLSID